MNFLIRVSKILSFLVLTTIFIYMIIDCMVLENNLTNKYCSGLSNYEYGKCQASIY